MAKRNVITDTIAINFSYPELAMLCRARVHALLCELFDRKGR